MRKKDHGKPENDDQLWEIVTSQVNPLKSARYAGVTEKAAHSHKPVAPRKIVGRASAPVTFCFNSCSNINYITSLFV